MARLTLQLRDRKSLLTQKARMKWLKEGDINSRYFHRAIASRRSKNGLPGLETDGEWIEEPSRVKEAVKEHFRRSFQRSGDEVIIELPDDFVSQSLDEAEGNGLIEPFSEKEIKEAVWDCESTKSPGPDGFNFCFFKECWEIIKSDLIRVMTEFHCNGRLARGSNSSFIVLIPKKEGASSLNHYRPISLIGSLYKVIAKVLAGRLRKVMDKVVGEEQSAFIKGRNILDGVVILNECIEEAKKTKSSRLIFKVDFAKAYDSVDWRFLQEMMKRQKFPEKWRRWIQVCLESASANVLVNGSPSGEFALENGIRQGDPLSPFLFLIVAEGLNLLIKMAVGSGLLKAAKIGRGQVGVSHIQYADDILFFCGWRGS